MRVMYFCNVIELFNSLFSSGLDLSHYITEETKSLLSNHPVYDLTGVICHKGSMGIGHYTCVVRCLNQPGQPDIGKHFQITSIISICLYPLWVRWNSG